MDLKKFCGGMLFSIGLFVCVLSGGCTALAVVTGIMMFFGLLFDGKFLDALQLAALPALFGGIPFAIGFGLFKLGKKMTGAE